MGTSGHLLKKADRFDPRDTFNEIKDIMDQLGYTYTADPISSEPDGYHIGIHDPECGSDLCMYIFEHPKPEYMEYDEFSWISPGLYTAVLFEDLCGSEYSIIKLVHRYLHIHTDEYFYAEGERYYTAVDTEKIYESCDRHHWCYK